MSREQRWNKDVDANATRSLCPLLPGVSVGFRVDAVRSFVRKVLWNFHINSLDRET